VRPSSQHDVVLTRKDRRTRSFPKGRMYDVRETIVGHFEHCSNVNDEDDEGKLGRYHKAN
jgi:hypothetical protein